MKYFFLNFFLCVLCLNVFGQNLSSDFIITPVNKMVKEFPDTFDLSSPLKSLITLSYIYINGKDRLLREVSTIKNRYYFPDSTAPDLHVTDRIKSRFLETTVKEIIYYKDSIACTISKTQDSLYSIRPFYLENGKWVQGGEDERNSIDESRQHFEKFADSYLQLLRRNIAISKVPTDTTVFIKYLKENGHDPKEFLLSKLNIYKLVTYGEIHRRKISWDFLQEAAKDKRFVKSTGVIFIEFEANKQEDIDKFFMNDTINKELILDIFRDYLYAGWDDKSRFDFLISLWHLNNVLPDSQKIRVIFVDIPRIFTEEGLRNEIHDRDKYMAEKILSYLDKKSDIRNALFIVGSGHVYRTEESAGAILARNLTGNTYSVFTHCPRVDNILVIPERIRHGMFDYAFYQNDDKPVAFELKNSPFGGEPFDGLYFDGTGKYQDNYDGYIFLGSLDEEKSPELLLDMYNENFIKEIDRRYKLRGWDLVNEWGLNEFSVKAVVDAIKAEYTLLRWQKYITPLKDGKMIN